MGLDSSVAMRESRPGPVLGARVRYSPGGARPTWRHQGAGGSRPCHTGDTLGHPTLQQGWLPPPLPQSWEGKIYKTHHLEFILNFSTPEKRV